MLELTGRLRDGWLPSSAYAPPEAIPELQRRIDAAAADAGRDPATIRRIYNLMGRISDAPAAAALLDGPPSLWVEQLTQYVLKLGFDGLVSWPADNPLPQLERFANGVVPAVRVRVGAA